VAPSKRAAIRACDLDVTANRMQRDCEGLGGRPEGQLRRRARTPVSGDVEEDFRDCKRSLRCPVLGKTYDTQVCSIARAPRGSGRAWSLLIIRDAVYTGSTRYIDFQRSLGIGHTFCNRASMAFLDAGIMRRQRYSSSPRCTSMC